MSPELGRISPPRILRNVDFPQPDDPMTARDRVSVENVMSFRTGAAASNRFVRCSRSSRIGEALFENPARVGDRNRENEIKDAEEEIALDEL